MLHTNRVINMQKCQWRKILCCFCGIVRIHRRERDRNTERTVREWIGVSCCSICSRNILDTFPDFWQTPKCTAFSDGISARAGKLCVMIISVALYRFTPVWWPWPTLKDTGESQVTTKWCITSFDCESNEQSLCLHCLAVDTKLHPRIQCCPKENRKRKQGTPIQEK